MEESELRGRFVNANQCHPTEGELSNAQSLPMQRQRANDDHRGVNSSKARHARKTTLAQSMTAPVNT